MRLMVWQLRDWEVSWGQAGQGLLRCSNLCCIWKADVRVYVCVFEKQEYHSHICSMVDICVLLKI